ncbi:MAG: orotate phosphoribosyltransferase [Planctomycetota bacterium]
MEPPELQALLQESRALLQGHFVLSSGKHSDRYIQCALLLQHPARAGLVGAAIGGVWRDEAVDVVMGPALGGIVVAHEVARFLGTRAIFAERDGGQMKLRRGFSVEHGERVLLVEDVVTTGGSVLEIARLVPGEAEVVGASAIVDRRRDRESAGRLPWPFRALVQIDAIAWEPDECPLCRRGLPTEKPGSRQRPT